jgi:hypothetical protein
MASTSNLQPHTFMGKNYELWSLTMKALFLGQYVWEIVKMAMWNQQIRQRTMPSHKLKRML